ncbi:hypothetical protein PTI98_013476 [Pleurotus ostreatus]|nr:hypothetical protein PTI98_013476 [Pleurotus ostreatus]
MSIIDHVDHIDYIDAPIHTKLVDTELLSAEERAWLNAYHAEVLEKVAPLLKNDERALRWLTKECQAI